MKPILCVFLPAAWALFIFWCFGADLTHQGEGLGEAIFLPEDTQKTLSKLNDDGRSFPEIADWIEDNVPEED
jgi:hypothetical protein